MFELNKIYFFNNTWNLFATANLVFSQIIDKQGNSQLSSISDIKKIEKKIKIKDLGELLKYLQKIKQLVKNSQNVKLTYIFAKIYAELNKIQKEITNTNSKIRTIRSIYKYPQFLIKYETEINNLEHIISKLKKSLWTDTNSQNNEKISIINNIASLKIDFENIKDGDITFNLSSDSWLKNISEYQDLEDIVKKIQKIKKKAVISFKDIYLSQDLLIHPIFQDKDFKTEFLYLIYKLNIISLDYGLYKDKRIRLEISKQLEIHFNSLLNQFMKKIAPEYNLLYEYTAKTIPSKEIPKLIIEEIVKYQENNSDQIEISKKYKELQIIGAKSFELLDLLNKQIFEMKPILFPWKQVIKKNINMINQIRGEIERRLEDYEQYSRSIEENNNKLELDIKIQKKLKTLEKIFVEYQNKSDPYFSDLPDMTPLIETIEQFENDVIILKKDIKEIFQIYKNKNLNIAPQIELWEDKYEEIINRFKFFFKNTISSMFNQFKVVLEKEQLVADSLSGISMMKNNTDLLDAEIISYENSTEKDLKNRITKITQKIELLEKRNSHYLDEKHEYMKLLEVKLENKGLQKKKCIICHKLVEIAEDHFIKCEFCNSLSHYTCAVWWIDKYNSCPVCHNKYTIPNNELFDPEQLEG